MMYEVDKRVRDAALADFHDLGLHSLEIEPDGGILATAEDPVSFRQFRLTIRSSPAGVVASCTEINDHPRSEDPFNLHRYEYPVGPAELLADPDLEAWFWRRALSTMLDLQVMAAGLIGYAAMSAANEEALRLTSSWSAEPAEPESIPEVADAFDAFRAACEHRAPFCQAIGLSWGPSLEGLPGVNFGLAPNTSEQILYEADPSRSKQLYLNGFWTAEYCLEKDLLEYYPDDAWARLGARKAARDLLDIQLAAAKLMGTQSARTGDRLVLEQSVYRLRTLLGELGPASKPIDEDDRLHQDRVMLFDRISDYVGSLHVAGSPTVRPVPEGAH